MTRLPQDVPGNEPQGMSLEKIEEIRNGLTGRSGRWVVNQDMLFKHAAALPPATRAGVLIAGWGPLALFPLSPVLYFHDWKLSLFVIFLCIFWVGMGRKYAQAAIRRQCIKDDAFLKFALSVGLIRQA